MGERRANIAEKMLPEALSTTLIAPCGMNCGLCSAYPRTKNRCAGCNGDDSQKPRYCLVCSIRHCEEKPSAQAFCFVCGKFPCARLRRLDKRYRTRYGMSMLENLASIRDSGLEPFVACERVRWTCPDCGGVICVHKPACIYCGHSRGLAP